MVGKKKKPAYYKQTKHKASISHALRVRVRLLSVCSAGTFSPKPI